MEAFKFIIRLSFWACIGFLVGKGLGVVIPQIFG